MVYSVLCVPLQPTDGLVCLQDFYDQELRLVVCGYIRPEADFVSLEALIARIHEDGRITKLALANALLLALQHDDFLRSG